MAQVVVIRCDRCNNTLQVEEEKQISSSWMLVHAGGHTYDYCPDCSPQVVRELRRKNTDAVAHLQSEEAQELVSLRKRISNIERTASFEIEAYVNGKSSGVSLSRALQDVLTNARRENG